MSGYIPWVLALVTFALVLAFAFWQRAAVSKAKKDHEHSAMTAGQPELRKSDGSDPGTKPH
ncbi:MAG: hypothetical protein EOP77_01215 [Variovorax sp.]|nr:MAG: hypothetical protein EOP77_01215 [Variovorax sp.]